MADDKRYMDVLERVLNNQEQRSVLHSLNPVPGNYPPKPGGIRGMPSKPTANCSSMVLISSSE